MAKKMDCFLKGKTQKLQRHRYSLNVLLRVGGQKRSLGKLIKVNYAKLRQNVDFQ